jgi:hypothetical protein
LSHTLQCKSSPEHACVYVRGWVHRECKCECCLCGNLPVARRVLGPGCAAIFAPFLHKYLNRQAPRALSYAHVAFARQSMCVVCVCVCVCARVCVCVCARTGAIAWHELCQQRAILLIHGRAIICFERPRHCNLRYLSGVCVCVCMCVYVVRACAHVP